MLVSTIFTTSLRIPYNVLSCSSSSHLSPNSFQNHLCFPNPTQPYTFFLKITFQVHVVGLLYSCVWGHPLKCDQKPPAVHSASLRGGDLGTSPLHVSVLTGLTFRGQAHCCELPSAVVLSHLWHCLLWSSQPLFHGALWALGREGKW